ncbi:hypothetical protein UlMin_022142 [Ulmus minor]
MMVPYGGKRLMRRVKECPYFNEPIYLQNKTQIGKVDEIFGAINESVIVLDKNDEGIVATSYSAGDKFYINPEKLLPLARFLPQPYVIFRTQAHVARRFDSRSFETLGEASTRGF